MISMNLLVLEVYMKNIISISFLASLFLLTSCSHFHKECCKTEQCKMKDGKCQDQCPMKKDEQCPMKKDESKVEVKK